MATLDEALAPERLVAFSEAVEAACELMDDASATLSDAIRRDELRDAVDGTWGGQQALFQLLLLEGK